MSEVPNLKWQKAKIYLLKQIPWKCGICGKEIQKAEDVSFDHIVPKSKGGNNRLNNLQLAHKNCNLMKGNKYP